jgi:hypothetical protein
MVSRPAACEIATFRDALGFSFELSHHHPRGHFAVVTGPGHRVLQITARLPPPQPGDLTVDLVEHGPRTHCRQVCRSGCGLLVISVDECGVLPFDEADRRAYSRSWAGLARCRLMLRDWIRTDGDLYLSAAYTLHPGTAWPDDPPAERRAEARFATRTGPGL